MIGESGRLARIQKELQECKRDTSSGVQVLVGEDLHHFEGVIRGPEGTPYEGGVYRIDIQIPADYPFAPPKMRFITKIWHPNISSQTGAICLDILKVRGLGTRRDCDMSLRRTES